MFLLFYVIGEYHTIKYVFIFMKLQFSNFLEGLMNIKKQDIYL